MHDQTQRRRSNQPDRLLQIRNGNRHQLNQAARKHLTSPDQTELYVLTLIEQGLKYLYDLLPVGEPSKLEEKVYDLKLMAPKSVLLYLMWTDSQEDSGLLIALKESKTKGEAMSAAINTLREMMIVRQEYEPTAGPVKPPPGKKGRYGLLKDSQRKEVPTDN